MSSALAEFSCGVCKEQFSHNSQDEKAPINGICSHKVCRDCVQKMHVAANTKPSGTFVKNLKCPICKQEKSFRADNLIVDVEFCRALKAIEALLPKRGNGDNSDNDNGTDHQHEENPSTAGADAKAKGEDVKVKTKPETDVTKPGGTGDLRIKKKKEESEECSEEAECSKSKPNQEIPDNNIDCEASSNPNEVALSSSASRRSPRHRMLTNYYGLGVSIDDEGKNDPSLPLSSAASPNNDDKPSTKSNAKASTEVSTSSRHSDLQTQTDRCDQGVSLKDREMSDRSLPLSPVTSPNIDSEAYVDSTAIESTKTATSSTSRRSGRSRVLTDRYGPGLRLEDEERRDPSLMISPDASPITGVEAATNSNAMVTMDATTTPKRPPRRRIQTKYYRPGMSLDGTREAGPDSLQSSIDGSKHPEIGVVTPINKRKRARFEESGSEFGSDYKDETESKSFNDNTLRNSNSKEFTPIDTIKRMRSKESEIESDSVFDSDADSDSEEDSGEDSDSEEDSGEDSDSEEDSGEDSDSEEDEAKSKTSKDDTCQNLGIKNTISRNGYVGTNPEGEGQINPAVVAIKQEYDGVHQHHQTLALNNRQYGDRVLLARQKKNGIMKLGGGNCGMLVYPSQKDAAKRNHPRFHDVGDRKGMCYDISWQGNAPKWAGFPSGDVSCVPEGIEPGEPFSVFVKHLMKNVTVGWEYLGEYRETNPHEDMAVWGDATALSILDKRKIVGDILKSAKRESGWGKKCINRWKGRLNIELERDKSAASAEKTATLSARARNLGYQENMTNAEVANLIVNLDEFHSAVGISFVEYNEKVYDYIKGGETSRNAQGKIRKNRESCMIASDWYDYYDKQCRK